MINLRGRIIPVVDLKKKLALGEVAESRAARIVVVKIHERLVGMLVDGASQVLKVKVSSIEPAPDEVVEKGGDYIRGVAKLEDRLIILVDLHRILLLDGRESARRTRQRGKERMRRASPWGAPGWRSLAASLALLAALGPGSLRAAEVAVLKSSEVPAWRPAIEALRRATSAHTLTEYDLRGDRAEAERITAALKGKAAILVAMGPLAAQVAHEPPARRAPRLLPRAGSRAPRRPPRPPRAWPSRPRSRTSSPPSAWSTPAGCGSASSTATPAVAKLVEEAQKAARWCASPWWPGP